MRELKVICYGFGFHSIERMSEREGGAWGAWDWHASVGKMEMADSENEMEILGKGEALNSHMG